MSETSIIVKFDLEGSHCWPDAPNQYADLRSKHGHIFHFEAQIPITTSRQLEFLEIRRILMMVIVNSYGLEPCNFGDMSCEDLANVVIAYISHLYNCGAIVRVFEDAFVGAEVRRLDD